MIRSVSIRWAVPAAVAALALAGCGSDSPEPLAASDAAALHAYLARARTAARSDDRAGAVRALRSFRRRVTALDDGGRITHSDAAALIAAARTAERRVPEDVAAPPAAPVAPAPAPQTTPAPPAPAPQKPQKPGKKKPEHGKGEGKGRKK